MPKAKTKLTDSNQYLIIEFKLSLKITPINLHIMKTITSYLILILCIAWLLVTSYKFSPFNSIGAIFTYKTGVLAIPYEENNIQKLDDAAYKLKIYVDTVGIPHIYGNSKNETAFGLGYMHAKDRYFQMEMMTRTVQGNLSEICAERTLKSDTFWKTYEFERKSKELLEEYKTSAPEFYAYLIAYAEGVNNYLKNNVNTDPLYTVFGEKPRQWKPEYSLLVTWYMSWSLSYFDHHIQENEVLAKLPAGISNYFYPQQPEGLKTILPAEKNAEINNKDPKLQQPEVLPTALAKEGAIDGNISPFRFHKGIGSNNWVINGAKAKDGNSMLANDPHLFLTLPEAFYEVQMASDKLNVYGFSIPGIPVIVSGHNDLVSWGITNGEWDLVDRYLLKVKNDNLYYYDGKWVPFERQKYTIKIKGGKEKEISANSTIYGKVIKEQDGVYYAQHWYAADKSYSAKAMYNMMQSGNWNEFKTAMKSYAYPPQNFIYADVNNNIGIVCSGKLPARVPGYKGGLLDGTLKYESKGALDTLWYTYNPKKNFLFSANQQPIQNGIYFGGQGSGDDYRVNRIYALLEEKNNWSPEDIKKMQSDNVDLSFFTFKTLINKYQVSGNRKEIIAKLSVWNGDMKEDSNAALVYEALRWATEQEAGKFAKKYLKVDKSPSFKYYLKYLNDNSYTILNSPPKKELYNQILATADSVMHNQFGDKWKTDSYSKLSAITIDHISFIPGLGEKIIGVGGNTNTINMNTRFHHPVFRAVYEMQKGNIKGYTIISGGQSGKINSKHYKDQLQLWKNGDHKETQSVSNPSKLKNITNTIIFK